MALISHYYESLCTILVVSTGLHVVIPPGQFGRIEARSSTIQKLHGLMTLNDVIDANYTGEIKLRFALFGFLPSGHVEGIITDYAKSNIALAQLILYPVLTAEMYHAEELPVTDRGNQGFGSTDGIKVVHHE